MALPNDEALGDLDNVEVAGEVANQEVDEQEPAAVDLADVELDD